jgi:hypothetical protein
VSALGPGLALNGVCTHASHVLAVTSSAAVSAGAVQLQGSLDGVNWYNMLTTPLSIGSASTTFGANAANFPAVFVRANVTTAITGGTVTCSVSSA